MWSQNHFPDPNRHKLDFLHPILRCPGSHILSTAGDALSPNKELHWTIKQRMTKGRDVVAAHNAHNVEKVSCWPHVNNRSFSAAENSQMNFLKPGFGRKNRLRMR